MADVTFDIETVGPVFSELGEGVREYLLKRAKTDEERERLPERTALELGLAQVVAIGIHALDTDRMVVLSAGGMPNFTVPDASVEGGNESWLLKRFWAIVGNARFKRVVTFNGRGYDGPVLMIRSAQLGIPCSRNLVGYRYDLSEHCDLFDVLQFQGSVRQMYALSYWCERFGIPSPKEEGITGADVGSLFREGRHDVIAQYVARDTRRTSDLYHALVPMLSTFKGGPTAAEVFRPRPQLALEV